MIEADARKLRRTPLHDWHVAHGARMVPFGGWELPVHYAGGITREHIATRTNAGLFDVCHMGRFRITGAGALSFLASLLTNDASALHPGVAQYTLLANEQGGCVDDAYLYRLGQAEFLLVVNAANRKGDWEWLCGHGVPADVALDDQTEGLAMFALQGPRSEDILERVLGRGALPEARRNRVSRLRLGAHELVVSRTGYTGEAVCFEIFAARAAALRLWQRIVETGAEPAGLGARDSLRLEAGLPLYGHEFGLDAQGSEIPIFANAVARFAVRPAGHGRYVGSAVLDKQRLEYEAIRQGRCTTPPARRLLKRLLQPIAAFASRRPLRAGYQLCLDGEAIGYVTSGTSVPVARPGASLGDRPAMRPIGLALIRSDLSYRREMPVRFSVRDARAELMIAALVERNLPAPRSPVE